MRHHDEAIERYLDRARSRPEVIGVLLTGSLANGSERTDSDIDFVVVVTDEAWREAVYLERVMVVEHDDIDYEGGYFDVKFATAKHLAAAAERGDDPARHSLGTAKVLYDQGTGLSATLRRIAESTQAGPDLVASFVAQARIHGQYFLASGIRHQETFLAAHAAVHFGLAAGRGLLADAGIRYPGPKDLLATLRTLPEPGGRFALAIAEVARTPSLQAARELLDLVELHLGRALPEAATLSRFVTDNELAWLRRTTPPEHR